MTGVVGYRAFRTTDRGRSLIAVTCGDVWTAAPHEARCLGGHPAPARFCHCGLHAFGDLPTVKRWRKRTHVVGAVRMTGTAQRPIIAGTLKRQYAGWAGPAIQLRAPYAQLVAILDDGRRARKVAAALGLPALPERDGAGRPAFERYAREHGEEVRVPGGDPLPALARPVASVLRGVAPAGAPVAARSRWVPPPWPSPWPLLTAVAAAAATGTLCSWMTGQMADPRGAVRTAAIYGYAAAGVITGWRLLKLRALTPRALLELAVLSTVVGVFAVPFTLFPGPYVWPAVARVGGFVLPPVGRLLSWAVRSLLRLAGRAVRRMAGHVAGRLAGWMAGHVVPRWRTAGSRVAGQVSAWLHAWRAAR